MQNYLLGGKDHFVPEQRLGEALICAVPRLRAAEEGSRRWRSQTVARLAGEAGVRQFLDLGPGYPDLERTHAVAQRITSDARVVYADADPIVMVHGRALDEIAPDGRLGHVTLDRPFRFADLARLPQVASTLDPREPVAVLACGFLQFAPDLRGAQGELADLMSSLARGSYLAVSHPVVADPAQGWGPAASVCAEAGIALQSVTLIAIHGYLSGLDLAEPGWQPTTTWLSGDEEAPAPAGATEYWAAIGRKP